jgi:Rieske Fe-S protein
LCGTAGTALASIPLIRFATFPVNTTQKTRGWSDAGPLCEPRALATPLRRTVVVEQLDGWQKSVSEKAVYITLDAQGKLSALSAACPHLGCSVQWQESKNEFVCPCHGASYKASGCLIGGPARRGLDALDVRVEDGRLLVRYQTFRQLVPTKEVIS